MSEGSEMPVGALSAGSRYGDDRAHGLIRTWRLTDAGRHNGAQLSDLIDKKNTASDVRADIAYHVVMQKIAE
jgi:transposase, IS5 family